MNDEFDLDQLNLDFEIEDSLRDVLFTFQTHFMTILKNNDVYNRYKFSQYSTKSNELYYTHAIKGIYLGTSIFPITKESDIIEYKVFCTSYLIHDLNKIYSHIKDRKKVWSRECVKGELEKIDELSNGELSLAFPEWNDYLEEIYIAIRGHSYTYNYNLSFLLGYSLSVEDGNHFDQDTMMYIIKVMQCVDLSDLIISSSENEIEVEFLDKNDEPYRKTVSYHDLLDKINDLIAYINPMRLDVGEPYHIKPLSLVQSVDFYENMKMNVVRDTIIELYNVTPFIDTFDGVLFMIPESEYKKMFDTNDRLKTEVLDEIYSKSSDLFRIQFKDLVDKGTLKGRTMESDAGGLKPNTYFKSQPNEKEKVKQLFDYLRSDSFSGLAYYPPKDGGFHKGSSRYKQVVKKMRNKIQGNFDLLDVWNEDQQLKELLEDEELWKISQAFRTILYLLSDYKDRMKGTKKENFRKMIDDLYEKLGIKDRMTPINDAMGKKFGSAHTRTNAIHQIPAYVFKYEEEKNVNQFLDVCEEYCLDIISEYPSSTIFDVDIEDSLKKSIQVFNNPFHIEPSSVIKHNRQCSHCGRFLDIDKKMSHKKLLEKYKWESQYSLSESKTEAFSNFLSGGDQNKAERLICDECKFKMYVNKLSTSIDDEDKTTFYIHSYYPTAVSHSFVRSLEKFFNRLQESKNGIMKLDLDATKPLIFESDEEESMDWTKPTESPLPIQTTGYISTTQKFIKKNKTKQYSYTDQYWKAFKSTLKYALSTNMKTMVSKFQTIPIDLKLNVSNLVEFQDYPNEFDVFLNGKNGLSYKEAEKALEKVGCIESIIKSVIPSTSAKDWIPEYINFIRNHDGHIINDLDFIVRLSVYHKNFKYNVFYDCIESIEKYYELCDEPMEKPTLQKMAELGLVENGADSKYKIAKTMSILLDQIEELYDESIEVILADVRTRIYDSLEENRKNKTSLQIEIDKFLDLARKMIEEDYNGNLEMISEKSQVLKNAYIAFYGRKSNQEFLEKKERMNDWVQKNLPASIDEVSERFGFKPKTLKKWDWNFEFNEGKTQIISLKERSN